MANVKISALSDGSVVRTTDQIPVNRAGTTVRVIVGTPATTAETTAAVTITDYSYVPYDLRRYGVDFSGSSGARANNVTVLNALGAATWGANITFYWPAGQCQINDTVTFGKHTMSHYFENGNSIAYYGTANKVAMSFGEPATLNGVQRTVWGGQGIYLTNFTTNPYTDDGFIGVRTYGTFQWCKLIPRRIEGFTVGWQIRPSTNGFAYNEVELGYFIDNKYNIDIHSFAASEFCNENLFLNGSFRCSAMSNSIDSYGVRFIHESGAYAGHNRNIFKKPSFELGNASGSTNRTAVLYSNNGHSNEFQDCRVEQGRQYIVYCDSSTTAVSLNLFTGAVLGGTFTSYLYESDGGLGYGNVFIDNVASRESQLPSYHSGDLVQRARCSDTAKISVKGCFFQATGSSTETYAGTGKIFKDHIRMASGSANAIGVYVDTTYYRSFLVRKDARASFGGRIAIVCYDSTGTVLTNVSGAAPYVAASVTLSEAASYGYIYYTPSDSSAPFLFTVGSTVAKIKVLFIGATASLHMRGFAIYALSYSNVNAPALRVFTDLPQSPDLWYCNGNPATVLGGGYVAQGEVALNSAAAAGALAFYQVTAAGYLPSAWGAAAVVEQGQLVSNDTGKVYQCLTAGTTAGSGGPTGTATSAITDNTAVWGYIGTVATISSAVASGSLVQGDVLYSSAADTLAKLAKSTTATHALLNTGSSNNPAWGQVPLATGVSGTLPVANVAAYTGPQAATAGLAAVMDVQTFTANGTWTVAAGTPKLYRVITVGGGGGGGGGARTASGAANSGGAGGGGGMWYQADYLPAQITSPVTVTVSATGGTAGTGATVDGNAGVAGGAGTSTTFGTYQTGWAGGLGAGGQTAANSGGGAGGCHYAAGNPGVTTTGGSATTGGANGGSGAVGAANSNTWGGGGGGGCPNATAGTTGGNSMGGGGGGGSGGGVTTGPVATAGGAGGRPPTPSGFAAGGALGGNPGAAGSTIATAGYCGSGASGGGGNAAGVGGAGAAGGNYGGGGSGGGGAVGGNGGAGGAGAPGVCIVITYF